MYPQVKNPIVSVQKIGVLRAFLKLIPIDGFPFSFASIFLVLLDVSFFLFINNKPEMGITIKIIINPKISYAVLQPSKTPISAESGTNAVSPIAEPVPASERAKLLFFVNTGEVVKSFVGDERSLFFDTEATVLFDEDTGDIVYSEYFDKFITKKMTSVDEES